MIGMDQRLSLGSRLSTLIRMNSRHASAAVFLIGFLMDLLTLPRIDHPAVPYLVGGHMFVIGACIILDRLLAGKSGQRLERIASVFPLLTAFSFGALLSFLFIYFARSSAPGASWPFLLVLGLIMLGSEFFRKKLEGLRFYVILYSYLWVLLAILFVPILMGKITVLTFFLSLIMGLVFALSYLVLLYFITPNETRLILPKTLVVVGVGVVVLVGSYLSGIMPAIPLVLKDAGVYSRVEREANGGYLLDGPTRAWYEGIIRPRKYQHTPGSPVYFYTAVFAPARIEGAITHDWQHRIGGDWVSTTRVSFPIQGGREKGYRGYSYKERISDGSWRVVVSLSDGRVVGRSYFDIISK